MRPAELANAFFMVAIIGRMVVAGNDTGEGIAKHLTQHFSTATGGDMKEDGPRRDKSPEVPSFALVFPAGLINIKGERRSGILSDSTDHRQAGIGDTFGGIADGTGGDANTKECLHNLGNTPAGDAMRCSQISDGCVGSRAKVGMGDMLW